MVKYLIYFLIGMTAFACNRDDDENDDIFNEDIMEIEQYLAANSLVAESTESGLHYIITEEGNGQFPNGNSFVTVDYVGFFPDGTAFDAGIDSKFFLFNVIPGWTEGIQKISKGGSGTLLIPSKLGYGKNGQGSIPGNQVILFNVKLKNF